MPGELFLAEVRVAKETTLGVPITPATRKLYLTEPVFQDEGEAEYHDYATGTPDNVRQITSAVRAVRGKAAMQASADELVEPMLLGMKSGVTPTTPGGATSARDWAYTVGATLESASFESHDAARPWQGIGVQLDEFEFTGDVDGAHMVNLGFMGMDFLQQALSGSPTDRVPTLIKGWETRGYIGAFGTDPATLNPVIDLVKKWSVKGKRNLAGKFLGNNSQVPSSQVLGKFGLEVELTVEASQAQALTEFNAWRAATKRVLRLEFGTNEQIESSPINEVQTLTEGTAITAGTFTLTYRGQTTSPIGTPWSAAQIQAALEALKTVGRGNVVCTGGPLDTTPVTITFVNQLGGMDVPQLTSTQGSLTGTFTHATTTSGFGFKRTIWLDIPLGWRAVALGESDANTRMYRLTGQYVYDPTLAYGFRVTLRNSRTAAW